MGPPKRVCIVGSGNWGSAISKIIGTNARAHPDKFEERVNMWVFEEEVWKEVGIRNYSFHVIRSSPLRSTGKS